MGSTDIAVSVKVGVVALSGFVPSFTDRYRLKPQQSECAAFPEWQLILKFDCQTSTKGRTPT
jgi:hypothetical protein